MRGSGTGLAGPSDGRAPGTREGRLPWLVAGVALVPLLGMAVPFQIGLRVELAGIVLALAVAWWWAPAPRRVAMASMPLAVRAGLALYAGGAVWGAAVGVGSGNPLRYVASQSAAMLLLPLAAVVFTAAGLSAAALLRGLAAATAVGLGVHVAGLVVPGLAADPGSARFVLRNGVSVTGIGPMAAVLFLGWWLARGGGRRFALLAVAGMLVLGGMARGAWVVTVLFAAVVTAVVPSRRRWAAILAGVGGLAVLVALLAVGGAVWQLSPRLPLSGLGAGGRGAAAEAVLSGDDGDGWVVAGRDEPLSGARAVDVRWQSRGAVGEVLQLVVAFGSGAGQPIEPVTYGVPGTGRWRTHEVIAAAPPDAVSVTVAFLAGDGTGSWRVREISAAALQSAPAGWVRHFRLRFDQLLRVARAPGGDETLDYRAREWRAVRAQWRRAGAGRLLAGHGLGAMVDFPNSAWDEAGRRITVPAASYLHNFYVFLLFKLGAAGLAALAGLLAVVAWTVAAGVRRYRSGGDGWFELSAAAAWGAYLVWSVSSPEIYDFRIAPLWGALIAAVSVGTRRTSGRPGGKKEPWAPESANPRLGS